MGRGALRKFVRITYEPPQEEEYAAVAQAYLDTRHQARLQFVFLWTGDERWRFHAFMEEHHPDVPRKSSFLPRGPPAPRHSIPCDGRNGAPCYCTLFVVESENDVTKQVNKNGVLLGRGACRFH